MTFEAAVEFVFDMEGRGISIDPADGAITAWGINQKYNPDVDCTNLTEEGAKAVYKRKYWDLVRCDDFPERIRLALFDAAVNPGQGMSVRFLQKALGVTADGKIGPITLKAAGRADEIVVLRKMIAERILYYASRPKFAEFGSNWVNRCLRVLQAE